MTREQYFIDVQLKERQYIQQLFINYFHRRGCANLHTTPITGCSSYDGTFDSGNTIVTIEFKRRNITTKKHGDTFIESIKFKELYKHHCAGNYTLFIVEYNDYYLMFDLQYEFLLYRNAVDHIFFYSINATGDNYEYQNGAKKKMIRALKYGDATIILDKTFQTVTYRQFLDERLNENKKAPHI